MIRELLKSINTMQKENCKSLEEVVSKLFKGTEVLYEYDIHGRLIEESN